MRGALEASDRLSLRGCGGGVPEGYRELVIARRHLSEETHEQSAPAYRGPDTYSCGYLRLLTFGTSTPSAVARSI
jgi:hypothetical protein